MRLPTINAVWIGKRMGSIHAACLRSFLDTGHKVVLHTYGAVEDAPRGIICRDANTLLPEANLLRYGNGSYAISANLIRYEILRRGLGLYVDCDVVCLQPMPETQGRIMAWESANFINAAVLQLPPDCPILRDLLQIADGWVPPWEPSTDRRPLSEYGWGVTGPRALTYFARKHALHTEALPSEAFYPLHHRDWQRLVTDGLFLEDLIAPSTQYVHLWHEFLRRWDGPIPPGSPLGRLLARKPASPVRRLAKRLLAVV